MNITKFGHSCLLIEERELRIITDPGLYSDQQNRLTGIDLILITHSHKDHCDINSIKEILKNNPDAQIITNTEVGKLLTTENIPHIILEDGQHSEIKGVTIEGIGKEHALIHSTLPRAENTGYLISNRLFYPGDALTIQTKKVEILALPVAGPWLKISESIDYAIEIKPDICFPIHDAGIKSPGMIHTVMPKILEPLGIKFVILDSGSPVEF